MKNHLKTTFTPRQYMLSKDFEIFYYDDSNLAGVKPHSHDYYEFYLFLSGNTTMHIHQHSFGLITGDVIVIPPGISHWVENSAPQTPYRRFVLWISKDFFQQLVLLSADYKYTVSHALSKEQYIYHNDTISMNLIQAKIFQLLGDIHSDRFGRGSRISLAINDLLLHLNCMAYEHNVPYRPAGTLTLFENLLIYIENHLEEDLSLYRLSEVFFVNKYHIAHLFKKQLGLPVHRFILKKRLELCRNALLSEPGISQTFLRYGFHDYSSFYRAFKKEYGMSPREYRERNRSSLFSQ